MKKLTLLMLLFTASVYADYIPVDRYGNKQYDQPSYKTEGNKIVPTDKFGNRQFDQQAYKTEGNNIIPVDRFGNKQYDTPSYKVEKDGRINSVDKL